MRKIVLGFLIFAILSLSLIHLASAQLVFSTTADNADNSGAHVSDNDVAIEVCSPDPNQPIEFYINQNLNSTQIQNATLDIFGFSTQFCGDMNTVKVNGNTVGSFASCIHQGYLFSVDPSLLVNGDNFIQINLTSLNSTHCAQVLNGSLIISNSTISPDSCVDTDGNNTATQGTVSGFLNNVQYSNNDTCSSNSSVTEFTCNSVIPVSNNISCGTDGFIGNNFCQGGNVFRNYTANFCTDGACGSSTTPVQIATCAFGCTAGSCSATPSCDDDKRHHEDESDSDHHGEESDHNGEESDNNHHEDESDKDKCDDDKRHHEDESDNNHHGDES